MYIILRSTMKHTTASFLFLNTALKSQFVLLIYDLQMFPFMLSHPHRKKYHKKSVIKLKTQDLQQQPK